jgi:aspartate carbamoyltransferase catalytic subunit
MTHLDGTGVLEKRRNKKERRKEGKKEKERNWAKYFLNSTRTTLADTFSETSQLLSLSTSSFHMAASSPRHGSP